MINYYNIRSVLFRFKGGEVKKVFSTIILINLSLFSDELKILKGQKRDITFLKGESFRELKTGSKNRIYYIYGIKDKESQIISNGSLIITFKNSFNLQNFEKVNGLKLVRKNSTGSYIFNNIENIDIIEKSNILIELENIKTVNPNWLRKRGLK